VVGDGINIGINNFGKIFIIEESIPLGKLLPAVQSLITGALPRSGEVMSGALSLIAPVASAHAARKVDVDTAVTSLTAATNQSIDTEQAARTQAITAEQTARTQADTAESQSRTAADTQLQSNIDAAEAARTQADTQLQGNIDAETQARDQAIATAIKTTLKDQPASPDLPPVTETSLAALAQATRNNLKWIRDYGGGGDTDWKAEVKKIKEALPPILADRDGFLVAARGGILIKLHAPEPAL
jgi:cytochrome c biogenesis protein ResB